MSYNVRLFVWMVLTCLELLIFIFLAGSLFELSQVTSLVSFSSQSYFVVWTELKILCLVDCCDMTSDVLSPIVT